MRLIDVDELIHNVVQINDLRTLSTKTIGEAIDNCKKVEAIPVEWILNKYRGIWEKAEMGRRDFQFVEVIDELLEDWEKENEID